MTLTGVISYPTPPYQNVPIQPEFYQPRSFIISDISLGPTTIVTTTANMDYVVGQLVRLLIPVKYGASNLNQQSGYVIAIPATNQVQIAINSIGIDPFIPSPIFQPGDSRTLPQILAIGDINSGQINENGRIQNLTYIPGSFINISPL